jgi:methylase of polypeptide subunit release factors
MPPETAGRLLRSGGDRLVQAGISGARRDARLLLQYATGMSQTSLVAEPDRMMADRDASLFEQFILRRSQA